VCSQRPGTGEEIVDRTVQRVGDKRKRVSAWSGYPALPVRHDGLISAALLAELRLRQPPLVTQARKPCVVERSNVFLGHPR
jgi:hypothetical protein